MPGFFFPPTNPREKAFDRLGFVRHDASQCTVRHRPVNSGPPAQKIFRDDNDVASTNSESLAFIRRGRSNLWSQHAPAGRVAMKAMLRNSLRACGRLLRLGGEVLLALLDFVINVIFRPKLSLTRARSLWLQQACRRALRILNVTVTTDGTIPLKGLLVCNQFSYLDIFVISAITPAVFISSSEVKRLPILGWFASLSGTLFVRRTHRSDVTRLNQEFSQILSNGGLVVLFPEPVDSNADAGSGPVRSSLLEPAARLKQ